MASSSNRRVVLRKFLTALRRKRCWSVLAGPGTGSMVTLAFGKRVPRPRPISNPTLTEEQNRFDGELKLFLKDAAWRIDGKRGPVCSSTDNNKRGGPMLRGLNRLVGKKVTSATVAGTAADLTISFSGGLRLLVFSVQTNSEDEEDNYSIHGRVGTVAVGPKGKLA